MSIGIDVLATAQAQLIPGLTEVFLKANPFFREMYTKGGVKKRTLTGPYLEFVVLTDSPGSIKQIDNGNEVIPGGRTEAGLRGNEYACRLIDHWDVPLKELALANGEEDMARILRDYPKHEMAMFHKRFAKQILSGGDSEILGLTTFNEDQNYVGDGGTRKGIFEFDAPASQTNTVHNISAATVPGWRNQFGTISSYTTDGWEKMLATYYACQLEGNEEYGAPTLVFADNSTYLNHLKETREKVMIVDKSIGQGDNTPSKLRPGVRLFDANGPIMYNDPNIDLTLFSTGESDHGVAYFLNPGTFEFIFAGHGGLETKGMFELRQPFRLPEQDMVRSEIVFFGNLYCRSRRHNGVVVGGANA